MMMRSLPSLPIITNCSHKTLQNVFRDVIASVVSCHVLKFSWDFYAALSEQFHKLLRIACVLLLKEGVGDTTCSSTTSSPHSVDVVTHLLWEIVIDYGLNVLDI